MDSPGPSLAALMTLPVEIVLYIADQLHDWWDIHNLMRAYVGCKDPNGDTTRRFQKLMFRTDARNARTLAYLNTSYKDQPFMRMNPEMLACHWAILMGDVKVALSAMPEYRAQGNGTHLFGPWYWRRVPVNLCPSGHEKNLTWGPICLNRSKGAVGPKRSVPFGVTALDLAAHQGRKDFVELLIDEGAEVGWSHPDKDGSAGKRTCVLAALCDWGLDLYVSEEQQAETWADVEELDGEQQTADETVDEDAVENTHDTVAYRLQSLGEEKLQVEEALFITMMEEGIDRPLNANQLRWTLETVLQGYAKRASSNPHPRLLIHYIKIVNYLTARGATFEGLHKKSVKILAIIGSYWRDS
ncbi:uncharacterized protein B0H64DRAFT_415340 [Chaetomium fimeti]|uniref:Uncharacterized protein n=1 Tax=Chaetomium fimeti TaxID=1854472 RepID=A0AAE0HLJ8_9PEZI|nr:hypothetical protein B0H64DRAFT_415340 [Chaetomium fimeti]